jgi:transposase InsO family protein
VKWSFSAAKSFLHCPRQWAFQHIAHHSVRDGLRREAHILRQLSTPWAWLGRLVQSSISQYSLKLYQ